MQALPVQHDTGPIKSIREQLQQKQAELKTEFRETVNTSALLKQHSRLIDELLQHLLKQAGLVQDVCLAAVGGYGRGELFPYSDVDILILLPDAATPEVSQRIESFIGLLWDIGLDVGHSVRTVKE